MDASFRGFRGMQVHAVPDADRAIDASGRKLPWGYDVDSPAAKSLQHREPVEKGPFGRSQRRSRSGLSRSRSRTAEPRREEDRIRAEQLAAEDAIFGSLRKKSGKDDTTTPAAGGRGREALGEVDSNTVSQSATPAATTRDSGEQEATEVMLMGFAEDAQWAALDFYERVSGGAILEDYDRQPQGQRYDTSRSWSRASSQKSLSRAALKKKNTFAGGAHWIKVTFDSRAAAELACARSPHVIKGAYVYAEPWHGRGPGRDEFISATQAGAQHNHSSPPGFSTYNVGEGSPSGSSTTATSATATGKPHASTPPNDDPRASSTGTSYPSIPATPTNPRTPTAQNTVTRRTRVEGVTPARLLPASSALLPKQHKQKWGEWLGTSEVIGSAVPKRDDGSFDYARANLYWRICFMFDQWLGTDICGLKID